MKRKSKSEIALIQDDIWDLCRKIIRYRDGTTCVTCGATGLQGSNQQTGHFIPDSVCGAYLRYDLRNLGVQCMRCNVRLSGNGALYYDYFRKSKGQEYVDNLFLDKQKLVKAIDHYRRILPLYQRIADNLPPEKEKLYAPIELLEMIFPKEVTVLYGEGVLQS